MIFGVVVDIAVGLVCIVLGFLIWKREKINFLHDYHYRNVKEEDIPSYTRLMGIGMILIGAGVVVTGILNLFYFRFWWIGLLVGTVFGVIIMNKAQKKYNGSWFS